MLYNSYTRAPAVLAVAKVAQLQDHSNPYCKEDVSSFIEDWLKALGQ
jgi:hypothetical protein